jgi:hypothetical protein
MFSEDTVIFEEAPFDERYDTYVRYVTSFCEVDGLWLEFGVGSGDSTKKYVEFMKEVAADPPLYGFDSFYGLPENWSHHGVGTFSTNGVAPNVDGLEVISGMFEDTLPDFVAQHHEEPTSLLIIDCDLYSSTKTVFDNLKDNIVKGTVIIFDELYNYPSWEDHEYKAFMEFVEEKDVKFKWIAYIKDNGQQASCIIESIGK